MLRLAFLIFIPSLLLAQGSWKETYIPQETRYDDFDFVNEKLGWTIRSYGSNSTRVIEVYRTDNGRHWIQVSKIYRKSGARSIKFYNDKIGFIGTLDSTILKTEDGGYTWTDLSEKIDSAFRGICGLNILDSSIYAVGAWVGDPVFLRSDDLGETWVFKRMQNYANALVDVYFLTKDTGIISGKGNNLHGIILQTNDGGISWQTNLQLDSTYASGQDVGQYIWKIYPFNDSIIFASIQNNPSSTWSTILKSNNRGLSWTELIVDSTSDIRVQGVGFLSENVGWVGGWGDGIYETVDGGDSWTRKIEGENYNRFQKINDTLMYASGSSIYYYSDSILLSNNEVVKLKPYQPKDVISSIYPNPADGILFITIQIKDYSLADLSVYDSKGKFVKRIYSDLLQAGKYSYEIAEDNLPSGVYFLHLMTNGSYDTKRFIIAK